ncbi:CocE/NonD family hydrolase [Streptomyces amakusaensis]|uniref:CocE/NonD family hydrolase n=1 Tax=Streptomyces amakusaensis TaxID=67271 RepID=A0ABW0ASV5_9ACTN
MRHSPQNRTEAYESPDIRRDDIRIPVRHGTLLYARVWRPVAPDPVPALLEYSPERLTDSTAPRDEQRHPWYAGHGYASVRVDARDHGNSGGGPRRATDPGGRGDPRDPDAEPDPDAADAAEVIDWLATRPWCTGRTGMFGIGAGADHALRTAALAPEPLAAVVLVGAEADPYRDGGRYPGGSPSAEGLHARSAALLSADCLPPDPAFAGPGWRELWLARLAAVEPAAHTWLAHQIRDDFWDRRAVPLTAVRAAVLAVAGAHGPHRETVLRLLETLPPDRVRGVLGPWAAGRYPDHGRPGPAVGFLHETLRWWDEHLKGVDSGAAAGPALRVLDAGAGDRWDGRDGWDGTPLPYALRGAPRPVDSPQCTGAEAGDPADGGEGIPGDQRADDAYSACFDFPVTGEPVTVLGRPRVTLRLRMDVPHGQAVARLCDVAPDGSSVRIALGVLNLAARHGTERAHAWPAGTAEEVTLALSPVAHTFAPGHRIRLAVSSAYWPRVWPQSGTADPADPASQAGFVLEPEGSLLELPAAEGPGEEVRFAEPEHSEPLGVSSPATLDPPPPARLLVRDLAAGEWRLETRPGPTGVRRYPDGLELTGETEEIRTIRERDPHSARARTARTVRLHRPELSWDVTVETRSETACDAADFLLRDEAVCRDGREIVFHRTWERRIPRLAG